MSPSWSVPFPFLIKLLHLLLSVSPILKSCSSLPSLSLTPHFSLYHCLSIFLSLHLCAVFPSLHLGKPGWVRVGPGGSGTAQPGRRGEQCSIQEAGRHHGNAPAPPSPRAGRACQEGAMVTSGACPPRAPPRPRTILQGWARRGRPILASAWSQEGLPSSESPFNPQCLGFPIYKVMNRGTLMGDK